MIDLHTHTTASDGTDSPFALVNKALSAGITVLGLTDHDTTSGWAEAVSAARKPISLALGAEISTLTDDGISVHMLGLLFDGENSQIQAMLSDARDTRIPRMKKMVELLRSDGFAITMEDVIAATPEGATLGRPHLADALVKNGVVKSRDEAFAESINKRFKVLRNPCNANTRSGHPHNRCSRGSCRNSPSHGIAARRCNFYFYFFRFSCGRIARDRDRSS